MTDFKEETLQPLASPQEQSDDEDSSLLNKYDHSTRRKPQGLLKSYHGVVYQIQWIMLVALEARRHGTDSGFTFRTEEEETEVGKFDDVVWQYRDGLSKKYNFLQCKHRLNVQEKITLKDLCKTIDQDKNPFSLQKYFISYRCNIKKNSKFKDGITENLIIATNIDFHDDVKQYFKVIRNINPVLFIRNVYKACEPLIYPRCLKIDRNRVEQDVITVLEETYDLVKLAKVLGEFIRNQLPFALPNSLKLYSKALYDNIVDQNQNRLSENFISGNNLSQQAKNLREAFFHELFLKKRQSTYLMHDYTLSDPAQLANVFAQYLQNSTDKVVVIHRKATVIRNNIDKLAWYVLILADGLKFNHRFWTTPGSNLPNETLNIFRETLIENLQNKGLLNIEDTQIDIANKLDVYRFKITNFVTFRKELVDELSFWDSVRDYNGFENFCNMGNTSEDERDLPNYTLNDIENNIQEFFDLLVFAVGYSRDCLSQVVQYDLRADFGNINNEYVAEAFRSEIAKCLDLVEDRFISTTKDVDIFFKTAKEQINRFILIGPTLEYRERSFLHNIRFSKKSNDRIKLRPYIKKATVSQVLSIIAVHNKLTSIKVHQILESIPEYQYTNQNGIFIFMSLSTVYCLLELVISSFEFNCHLLIIECDITTTSDQEQYLHSELCRILSRHNNKKVIFINGVNLSLLNLFKNTLGDKFKVVVDNRNNMLNLTKQSQDNILSKTNVIFQGAQINLSGLLGNDLKYLVAGDVLYDIVIGKEIKVGATPTKLGKVKDYYIPRTFSRKVMLRKHVLKENDKFAISNTDEFRLCIDICLYSKDRTASLNLNVKQFKEEDLDKYSTIKFIILNKKSAKHQFTELCRKYQNFNIHWLTQEGDYFIWKQTHGCLSNLYSYISPETKEYKEIKNQLLNTFKVKKGMILSAEPGLGKSTVMTNLESLLKSDPYLWTIRVDLLLYSTDLKENVDEAFVIKIIYTAAKLPTLKNKINLLPNKNEVTASIKHGKLTLKGKTKNLKSLELLEIMTFNRCFNKGKVVILFDGYDEICSFYETKVIKLLQILNLTSVAHIFVTTRPYKVINNLENTLNEFTYTLKPLNHKEQVVFLLRYWKSNLNLSKINETRAKLFIDELLQRFSEATSDVERNFVSIPLQLQMLADNFQSIFEEFYQSNVKCLNDIYMLKIKKQLNLVNLYEDFVNIKFEKIRFKEKKPGINVDYNDMLNTIKRERQKFIAEHRILAMYALFKDNLKEFLLLINTQKTKTLYKSIEKLKQDINKGDDENGIISCAINDTPIFVHQSFAEYFVSSFLWENFKKMSITNFKKNFVDNLLLSKIFMGNYLQVCRFFYYSAEKDLLKNIKFRYRDEKVMALLESLVHVIDTIYFSYQNGGTDLGNGTDDIPLGHNEFPFVNDRFITNSDQNIYKGVNYVQCIKLLFKIVECHLSRIDPNNDSIIAILKINKRISILCISAELGCLNFVKLFVESTQLDYKRELLKSKWYFTPIWLAAKNYHLEIVNYLKNIYDPSWKDKDDFCIAQRIYNIDQTDVLKSCLASNFIDSRPYLDIYSQSLKTPLMKALDNQYPSDIVKLLIKGISCETINNLTDPNSKVSVPSRIVMSLMKHDSEIVNIVLNSGILFSGCMNVLLFEYRYACFEDPFNLMKYSKSLRYFPSDTNLSNLINFVKLLLKAGVSFNTKDNIHNTSTLQYSRQIYYINKLLSTLTDIEKPTEMILRVIFECVLDKKMIGMSGIKIETFNSQIRLHGTNNENISLVPDWQHQQLKEIGYASYDKISSNLYKLRQYLQQAEKEINYFKEYPDSKLYNNILIGYKEMLEFSFTSQKDKTKLFESLGCLENKLLGRVLNFYIRQDYQIKDAFKEVAGKVLKAKALARWIKDKHDSRNSIMVKELVEIFNLDDIVVNEELIPIGVKIYEANGLETLYSIWSNLSEIGEKNIHEVLRTLTKYMSTYIEIYELFENLHNAYDNLSIAIRSKEYIDVVNTLQNLDKNCYKKAIINGQDDFIGSPLHYAVNRGDLKLTKLLLSHGANPNYKLECHGTLLEQETNADDDSEEYDYNENYEGYSSLHLAVINAQVKIIKLLIKYGANCNIRSAKGDNSLQLAEEKKNANPRIYGEIINILNS